MLDWLSKRIAAPSAPRTGLRGNILGHTVSQIPDVADAHEYANLQCLLDAMREGGFEACELAVGIDFTKSNRWTGKICCDGRCLHAIDGQENPYMLSLKFISNTMNVYDDDHRIPCYGFGDVTTGCDSVFSFYCGNEPAPGLDKLLQRYKEIVPRLNLSGPTSFAPLIRQVMRDVYDSGMKFHMLLILADGQISDECVEDTKAAIVEAASFPISIVMIGVGDGPWDGMERFDIDVLPNRRWDNFHFFELNKVIAGAMRTSEAVQGTQFEQNVLEEIPRQFEVARGLTGVQNKARAQEIINTFPSSLLQDPPNEF